MNRYAITIVMTGPGLDEPHVYKFTSPCGNAYAAVELGMHYAREVMPRDCDGMTVDATVAVK